MAIQVFLFGGVGNQLFQVARALEHKLAGRDVILVDCSRYAPIVSKVLGWTLQKDWLDISKFAALVGLKVRPSSPIDLLMLSVLKFFKGLFAGAFDRPISAGHAPFVLDAGYFQSVSKVSCRSAMIVARSLCDFLDISRHREGRAVIHYRGSDFAMEDRISAETIRRFGAGQIVFWVSDDELSIPQNNRYQSFNGGGPLEDFRFIAGCEKLLITRSTFGLWAALVAKQLGPTEVLVHQFSDWEAYLSCPTY